MLRLLRPLALLVLSFAALLCTAATGALLFVNASNSAGTGPWSAGLSIPTP